MHSKALFSWWAASLAFASSAVTAVGNEERATHSHYPITGIQTGVNQATGARPPRRNILDLQEDEPAW
jgi:tyrosinase